MEIIKKTDNKEYLVENGFADAKLNTILLETKLDSSSYSRLISIIKELNEHIKIVAHDFFAAKEGAELFYKVKELGNTFTATIFANPLLEKEAESLFDWTARLLKEMDIDDVVCYRYYKTVVRPDKVREAAEHFVEEYNKTLVNVAGHYGFVFKPERCPSINVDLSMWDYVFAPSYAFIGIGWNKAFPLTATTLATTLQVVPKYMQRGMMSNLMETLTPAIKSLLCAEKQ